MCSAVEGAAAPSARPAAALHLVVSHGKHAPKATQCRASSRPGLRTCAPPALPTSSLAWFIDSSNRSASTCRGHAGQRQRQQKKQPRHTAKCPNASSSRTGRQQQNEPAAAAAAAAAARAAAGLTAQGSRHPPPSGTCQRPSSGTGTPRHGWSAGVCSGGGAKGVETSSNWRRGGRRDLHWRTMS